MTTDDIEIDPRIERIVWKGLGLKSVRQMAEETGLEPEQVYAIKRELLSAVDVLTVQEKRQKILIDMEKLAQDSLDRAEGSSDEFFAGMMNAARGAMKDMLTALNQTAKGEQEAIDRLNGLRVKELLSLIDRTVAYTLAEIATTYDVSEDELQDIFQKHLKPAAQELEA